MKRILKEYLNQLHRSLFRHSRPAPRGATSYRLLKTAEANSWFSGGTSERIGRKTGYVLSAPIALAIGAET